MRKDSSSSVSVEREVPSSLEAIADRQNEIRLEVLHGGGPGRDERGAARERARAATFGAATFIDPSSRCESGPEASALRVDPETSPATEPTAPRRGGLLQGVRRCFGIDEEEVPELMARQSDRIEQLRDLVRETQEMHEVALAQVYSEEVEPLRRKLRESDLAACVQDEEMLTLREQLQRAQDRSAGAEVAHRSGIAHGAGGSGGGGGAAEASASNEPVSNARPSSNEEKPPIRGVSPRSSTQPNRAPPTRGAPPNSGRSMFRLGLRRGSSQAIESLEARMLAAEEQALVALAGRARAERDGAEQRKARLRAEATLELLATSVQSTAADEADLRLRLAEARERSAHGHGAAEAHPHG